MLQITGYNKKNKMLGVKPNARKFNYMMIIPKCSLLLLYLGLPLGAQSLTTTQPRNLSTMKSIGRLRSSKLFYAEEKDKVPNLQQNIRQIFQQENSKDQEEDEEEEDKWLDWMSGGKRKYGNYRGSGEVIHRSPVALGGLPRSDRYASRDWLHNTITLPNSAILRNVLHPVLFMTIWGLLISIGHRYLVRNSLAHIAKRFCIPTAPHSLTVSALGLLLVFRTNSAYQRFAEGRVIWEQILSTARELSRLVVLYENEIGIEKRRRVQRLLAAFPYLLRYRIRPNSIMKKMNDPEFVRDPEHSIILYQDYAAIDTDPDAAAAASDEEINGSARRKPRELFWVDRRTLPWRLLPSQAIEDCTRAQNRPLWVCDRMAKELHSVPDGPNFTARERLTLLSKVDGLSRAIGSCERIHQTVVPLNYARHALRSLTVWLLSLPFALVKDLGLMTGPVLFILSWMLFGVYEIGYSIEDPFQGTLRLSILCDAIRRDVLADEVIRFTAFKLKEPVTEVSKGSADDVNDNLDDDDDDDLDGAQSVVEIEDIIIDDEGNYVVPEEIQANISEAVFNAASNENLLVNGSSLNQASTTC
jgi:predicted membrane chloride channel (bestrophin family)